MKSLMPTYRNDKGSMRLSPQPKKTLTLVTAFYVLPAAKFPKETYTQWLTNFLQIVWYNPHIYLVIYTDAHSSQWLPQMVPNLIRAHKVAVIERPMEEFHMWKYADFWRKNHDANVLLRRTTSWELNMLWNEKLWFLRDVVRAPPAGFERTAFYAWCDAGYFRSRPGEDLETAGGLNYARWAAPERMAQLDPRKIYYALVNSDVQYVRHIKGLIQRGAEVPADQVTVGGGFCMVSGTENIEDWCLHYENVLMDFMEQGRLVKDDQIILANCIFSGLAEKEGRFFLVKETGAVAYDPWFVFQRFLLN
jgi:hypothetical protein